MSLLPHRRPDRTGSKGRRCSTSGPPRNHGRLVNPIIQDKNIVKLYTEANLTDDGIAVSWEKRERDIGGPQLLAGPQRRHTAS